MKLLKSTSRFFLVIMLLMVVLQVSAQEKQMYVVVSNTVATFYYDELYNERNQGDKSVYKYKYEEFSSKHDRSYITKVIFDVSFSEVRLTSTAGLFSGMYHLKKFINIKNLNTSNVTNMSEMFSDCQDLTSLDLSSFDTWSVASMGGMFNDCTSLKSLSIGKVFTRIPSFPDSKNIKRIVSYQERPYTFSPDCFASGVYENAKLYIPQNTKELYISTDGRKEFKHILSKDIDPKNEGDKNFEIGDINGNTDLDGNILDNMFFNISAENGGYDADDKCIVLTKAMTEEQMKNITGLDLFDSYLLNNFRGTIFMVNAGSGNIIIDAETLGNMQLSVKIGNAEPTSIQFNGRGEQAIPYNVDVPTFVFVYGAQGNTTEDTLKIYSIRWGDIQIITKEKEMYVVVSDDAATFYYDNLYDKRSNEGMKIYKEEEFTSYPNRGKITRVVFDASFADARPSTTSKWFYNMYKLNEIIGLEHLNTSKVMDMSDMFNYCKGLTSLDVRNFVTNNVTNMSYMFRDCSGLTSLDVRSFDTSKVTNMSDMFNNCSGLTSIDLRNFNTSGVTNMRMMFYNCKGLTSINLSNFDTSKVTDMSGMFDQCSGLTSLDLSNFDTSKVTNMRSMFSFCNGLTSIDLSKFDTSNVTDMSQMFSNSDGFTNIDVSNFDTSKVTNMSWMFSGCYGLTSIDLSNFDTSRVTDMRCMFLKCSGLTSIDLNNFETSKVTDMSSMFSRCNGLTSLNINKFNTSRVRDMGAMFEDCSGLTSLDVSKFDTGNVTDMSSMFSGCSRLTSIDVSKFYTGTVLNMNKMFSGCSGLTNIDVSNFNTRNVLHMEQMFSGCSGLTSIDLSSFDTWSVANMGGMFNDCTSLKSLSIGKVFARIPSFPDSKNIKRIVSYQERPYTFSPDCFASGVYENAKLYIPQNTKELYISTDGWKEFKHILSKDIDPEDEGDKNFGDVDENTDLNGNIVSNVFLNIPAEDGGYDADNNCIVLKKATTDEQVNSIIDLDLFDEYLISNFTGLVFLLDAGNGTIELEAETLGNMQLNVKIGDAEPTTQKVDGKSKVSIPYNVTEPTYVYVYGTTPSAAKAKSTRSANATDDALKLYSIAWGDATGISNINMSTDKQATIYNLNGQRVTTPGKGLYIVNGKKVILK